MVFVATALALFSVGMCLRCLWLAKETHVWKQFEAEACENLDQSRVKLAQSIEERSRLQDEVDGLRKHAGKTKELLQQVNALTSELDGKKQVIATRDAEIELLKKRNSNAMAELVSSNMQRDAVKEEAAEISNKFREHEQAIREIQELTKKRLFTQTMTFPCSAITKEES